MFYIDWYESLRLTDQSMFLALRACSVGPFLNFVREEINNEK
jgi:hypothetical protein